MINSNVIRNALLQRLGLEGAAINSPMEKRLQMICNLGILDLIHAALAKDPRLTPDKQRLILATLQAGTHVYTQDDMLMGTLENGALPTPDYDDTYTENDFPNSNYGVWVPMPADFIKLNGGIFHNIKNTEVVINVPTKIITPQLYHQLIENYYEKPDRYWMWAIESSAFTPAKVKISKGLALDGTTSIANVPATNAEDYAILGMSGDSILLATEKFTQVATTGRNITVPAESTVIQLIPGKDYIPYKARISYLKKPQDIVFDIRGDENYLVHSELPPSVLSDILDFAAVRFTATKTLGAESYQIQDAERKQ